MTTNPAQQHGIKDNHTRGRVADFLSAIRLFDACTAAGIREVMDAQAVATEIFHPRHPIYGQLFELQTLEVVRLIEGGA